MLFLTAVVVTDTAMDLSGPGLVIELGVQTRSEI